MTASQPKRKAIKRVIRTSSDMRMVMRLLDHLPVEDGWRLTLTPGANDRTLEQHMIQHGLFATAADQLGWDHEHARGYCKLHYAVPVLRRSNDSFLHTYDTIIRPLRYEDKLALMGPPIDLPVTSLMKRKEFAAYLLEMQDGLAGLGVALDQRSRAGVADFQPKRACA